MKSVYRTISFLGRDDALRLIQEPVEGRISYGEGAVEAIYRLTSGHPYYTQVIGTHVVDYLNSVQRNTLEIGDLDEIVHTIIDNPPPSMMYTWDELTTPEQTALSLLSEACEDGHTFLSAEALAEAIEENNYPLNMAADTLHGLMEGLYQQETLERNGAGAYRFRVDLFRRWIQRARSIWRLMEEVKPKKKVRTLWVGIVLVVLVVAVGLVFWERSSVQQAQLQQPAPPAQSGTTTGDVWVESDPSDVEVLVNGKVRFRSTPVMIPNLKAGICTIEVRRADYHAWRQSVSVQAGKIDSLRFSLQRIMGLLSVTSRPAGAKVSVYTETDKETRTTNRITPFQGLELPTGTYDILVRKAGYVEQRRSITLTETIETVLKFDLQAHVGNLYIVSEPEGAAIFLDSKKQATRTPARLNDLPVDSYRLGVELENYQHRDTAVTVRLSRTDTVSLALALLPTTLELVSNPAGAAIYVDGADTVFGVTPEVLILRPDRHRIRVQFEGYEAYELEQDFLPGKRYKPSIVLEPHYGWVRVVRPLFGTITVDGTDHKVPPGTIRLQVGSHTLRIAGGSESKTIYVSRDDTIKVSLP